MFNPSLSNCFFGCILGLLERIKRSIQFQDEKTDKWIPNFPFALLTLWCVFLKGFAPREKKVVSIPGWKDQRFAKELKAFQFPIGPNQNRMAKWPDGCLQNLHVRTESGLLRGENPRGKSFNQRLWGHWNPFQQSANIILARHFYWTSFWPDTKSQIRFHSCKIPRSLVFITIF